MIDLETMIRRHMNVKSTTGGNMTVNANTWLIPNEDTTRETDIKFTYKLLYAPLSSSLQLFETRPLVRALMMNADNA